MSSELSPAAYRAIISAYGNAFDPSSSCWVFFDEMQQACDSRGMNVDSWNALLGALASQGENENQITLNPLNSTAARRHGESSMPGAKYIQSNQILYLVEGKTCSDAALCILDAMRNQSSFLSDNRPWAVPRPNSQTYCQVASAQSRASSPSKSIAKMLFEHAKADKCHLDGRFLNALLRCYGSDIESALDAWKRGIASAAAGVSVIGDDYSAVKRRANLAAAYNGLMHVCGRALRPDVALRICYAMNKAGVEPNEVSLNSYQSGKRIAMNERENKSGLDFKRQYESLLTVECTKYNTKDKRRASDKKIRIILGS